MIRTGFVVLAGALFAAGAAAQVETNPQAPASPSVRAQSQNGNATLPSGTAINAQLNSSVDSKKAKVGDRVEAHTTEEIKYGGKTIVPQGTKLEGHVTEATARSKGDSGSTLAIQFDKALPKKGAEISLNVAIMAVAAPQNEYSNGASSDPMGPTSIAPNPASGASPMGTSHTPTATPTTPNYPSSGSSSLPAQLPANSRGVYGLKDLKLMASTAGTSEATVITSDGKNVRLDSGTRLLLVSEPTAQDATSK